MINRRQGRAISSLTHKLAEKVDAWEVEESHVWEDMKADHNEHMNSFHMKEAEKYERKAQELEAQGKSKAAARARKVADMNRAKAEKKAAK